MSKSAFTAEQERWIIFRFGDSVIKPSAAQVRRQFRNHFNVSPFHLPKPNSIEELMEHVSDYVKSIPREVVYKAVKDIYKRAGCCLENGGGAFESRLKMYKKNN